MPPGQRILNIFLLKRWFMSQRACVCRDITHAESLESTKEAQRADDSNNNSTHLTYYLLTNSKVFFFR